MRAKNPRNRSSIPTTKLKLVNRQFKMYKFQITSEFFYSKLPSTDLVLRITKSLNYNTKPSCGVGGNTYEMRLNIVIYTLDHGTFFVARCSRWLRSAFLQQLRIGIARCCCRFACCYTMALHAMQLRSRETDTLRMVYIQNQLGVFSSTIRV